MSQWPSNCDASMWKLISNSSDINFILCDIHGRSCKKLVLFMAIFMTGRVSKDVHHYNDVILSAMASQITSLMIVYSTAYTGADERKHQSSASLAFVRGIHRWPVNSPHKWPAMRKIFPFQTSSCTVAVAKLVQWQHFKLTKDTPYLIQADQLRGVFFM